jgi:predicted ATPase/DNA-binding CsgD family transcriptional regulator
MGNLPQGYDPLTERELEILRLMADGLSNLQIADQLYLTVETVKWYNKQTYQKLGVDSRTQAVDQARKLGLFGGAAHRSPNHLPAQTTPFIGREEELAELGQCLSAPESRLLTLVGPGGSGKTRLAIELATKRGEDFPHGVHFVSLTPLNSPDQIVPSIAGTLGLPLSGDSAPVGQLFAYLRKKRLLLILDGVEHLLDGVTLVADLIEAAPQIKLLVTSREALNLPEEWVRQVNGMRFPIDDQAADLESYSAIQLFVDRARRIRSDFSLTNEQNQVIRVCYLVSGLPLAIELAASWVRLLPCEDIAREIEHGLDILETNWRDVPERHRSIRAVFEHSWKLLTGEEKAAFRKLSVFRGGFTAAAAEQIAGAPIRALTALVDKSLVQMVSAGRYDVHELVRQYSEEQLEAAREIAATQQAHSRYYAAFIRDREADLKGKGQLDAIRALKEDWDNVRTACLWMLDHRDFDLIDRCLEGLFLFGLDYRLMETQDLWRHALDVFAPHPDEEPHPAYGRLLARTVFLLELRGPRTDPRSGIAQQRVETALTIARQRGDPLDVAYGLFAQGLLLYLYSDYNGALRWYADSLNYYGSLNDGFHLGQVYGNIYACYFYPGQFEAALPWAQRYLDQSRAIGNKVEEGWALYQLGLASIFLGRMDEAEPYLYSSKAIMDMFGNSSGVYDFKMMMSLIAFHTGDLPRARASAKVCVQLANDADDSKNPGVDAMGLLATIECLEGNYTLGKKMFDQTLGLISPWNDYREALVRRGLALYYCDLGDDLTAQHHLRPLRDAALKVRYMPDLTSILPIQAVLLARQGQSEQATERLGLAFSYPSSLVGWMEKWPLLLQVRSNLERELGAERFEAAWERGKTLNLETAVAELNSANAVLTQDQHSSPQT